jgi:hypothetical protein
MSALDFALRYADRGWRVFPCAARAKKPAGWLAPHGFKDASTDHATIRSWFRDRTLNIGIACGLGLVVLDIDPRNGGDDELAALENTHGALPHTPRVLTGGGGTHYYSQHDGEPLKNGAIAGCVGVEIKTDGGYVVAPASIHPDTGRRYVFDLGALPSETPLAPLPAWLAALAVDRPRGTALASSGVDARLSVLGQIFERLGGLGDLLPDGRRCVRCPWVASHSDGRGDGRDTSTVIFPRAEGSVLGSFRCSHSHCSGRTWKDVFDLVPTSVRNAASLALAAELRAA